MLCFRSLLILLKNLIGDVVLIQQLTILPFQINARPINLGPTIYVSLLSPFRSEPIYTHCSGALQWQIWPSDN
jgi:hypothetical protein